MSTIAFAGAVELGLVYAFVGLAVFLSFRILDFPDLTVDGSFPLGAAVAAVAITDGVNPWLATAMAAAACGCAGLVTAALNQRFRILHLLASILTMCMRMKRRPPSRRRWPATGSVSTRPSRAGPIFGRRWLALSLLIGPSSSG